MREMKDSGIEWAGNIPNNWAIKTYRNITIQRDGGAWGTDPTEDNQMICMRIADFDYGKFKFSNKPVESLTKRKYTKKQILNLSLQAGDILIEKSGGGEKTPVGRAVIFDKEYPALFANFMDRIRVNNSEVTPQFVVYWLGAWYGCKGSPYFINQTTGIQNIDLTLFLAKAHICYPKLEEQQAIADFLDSKCADIDSLTGDIQKQIEILKEYKKSIITRAVTKGLDPNVEMKDSGIEWIGRIPKTWNILPLYMLFSERKNRNSRGKETNLLSLSYGRIIRKNINTNIGLLPESFNTYNIVEKNDIIIRPTDLQNDKKSLRTGLVKEHGIITSAYIALIPLRNINSIYFHYLLHAYDVAKVFYNMGNGVRQGLNYSEFCKLLVVCPNRLEQQAIVDSLDTKCADIDAAIEGKQKQLDVLKEYKKSLIYEYVTGKKEVPCCE